MSKFQALWEYVQKREEDSFAMTFDEVEKAAGLPIDHSFLTFKKELKDYGYEVGKISLKQKTVSFQKL